MIQQVFFAFLCSLAAGLVLMLLARLGRTRSNPGAVAGIVLGIPLAVAIQLGAGLEQRWHPLVSGLSIGLCGVVFGWIWRSRKNGA
ncbi:hypothetical protein [Rhodanobacter sp. DHB23]|uniref:hypothetical protein n=1 Tax=Rhodanobacter sp. DHB23 TaxID=2775923 RepID=UPI001782D93B|nr:hypothetical protein [Rhodanobacter sp. DHB23]MBD8874158.1 hypothetical protein [Rhodanobacter sp. DHB23]